MAQYIDLRSDTVTKPTPGMRAAMAAAEVGDDIYGEDPTVNRLEAMVCELFGKEAAVYACSGTQSNQMGLWAQCHPGDEILIEAQAHVANYEAGAPAVLSGVSCRMIPGREGMLSVNDLEGKIRPGNLHFCRTRLVCLENTTNAGGGRVYPQSVIDEIAAWTHSNGLRLHMDGARLFNASIASGIPVSRICRDVDSVSICFSKGLGCPMGSMLISDGETIARARKARKIFGGGLRQAGIPAASAIYALENHVLRLAEDHDNARAFAAAVSRIPGVTVDPPDVQSNLVFITLARDLGTAAEISGRLKGRGVLIYPFGPQRLRACSHLDVDRAAVMQAAAILAEAVGATELLPALEKTPAGPYAG